MRINSLLVTLISACSSVKLALSHLAGNTCVCDDKTRCSLQQNDSGRKNPDICYQGEYESLTEIFNSNPTLSWACGLCSSLGYDAILKESSSDKSQLWYKKIASSDDVCGCNDGDNCALLPPVDATFPCYQGTQSDAKFTFYTDPLLVDGTTWVCGNCADQGYPTYLRNDPIYTSMELWTKDDGNKELKKLSIDNDACSCDSDDTCALIPPATASSFPCYQGSLSDAKFTFNTDPLLASGTTWACGKCVDNGYDTYLRNDPIYRTMELWSKSDAPESSNKLKKVDSSLTFHPTFACGLCLVDTNATCAIIPPADKRWFCYEGDPWHTFLTFNTDPFISSDSTWSCSPCSDNGYRSYFRNDPVHKTMQLWVKV